MCLTPRTYVDNLNRIESFKPYDVDHDFCDYVDVGENISISSSDLGIMQLNIRGLYSKIDKLKSLLNECTLGKQIDVILLCETWQSKTSPIPKLDGYSYIYKHRQHKLGGGVGMFVSDRLKYKERSDLYVSDCSFEFCLIEVKLKHENVLLCSGYRAPNTNPNEFLADYEKLLHTVNAECNKLIIGIDHNLDLLKHRSHAPTNKFVELFESFQQIPSITRPTRITKSSATLIDNIFVPTTLSLVFNSFLLVDDMSDHLPIVTILRDVELCSKSKRTIETRDLRPKYVEKIKCELSNVNWDEYLTITTVIPENVNVITENVNEIFDKCHDKVMDIIDTYSPIRKREIREKGYRREPWLTSGILKSCKKQKKMYMTSIKGGATTADVTKYREYRNVLNRIKRKEKISYYHELCKRLMNNTKKLWEIVNHTVGKTTDKTCILDKLRIGNVTTDNPVQISNELATYFANVGPKYANAIKKPDKNISDYLKKIKRNDKSIFLSPTTPIEIINLISNLPNKSSSGFDQLNNKLLKELRYELATPLCTIFNLSLNTGCFPTKMKYAEIVPLYKSKSKLEASNCLPISLLITISKILEKIIYRRTYEFLDNTNQIYRSQYGFRAKHSCEHAIGELISNIVKNQQNNKFTASLFLDLSKAFDTLDHKLLLSKMEIYGIRGAALHWFETYLSERKLRVKCQASECGTYTYSNWHLTTHGAPQGSCLGPLLFLIFCNDLQLNLTYLSCIQFADDTTLYYSHRDLRVLRCCIENDLTLVMDWFKANSLTLNVQKTNLMLFPPGNRKCHKFEIKLDNIVLKPVHDTKFLGVIIDNELKWKANVQSILMKMKRNFVLMCRGKKLLPPHNLKLIYYGHIYSHMSYCIGIWGSMANNDLLSKIRTEQNKCIRLLCRTDPLKTTYKKYRILKLDDVIDLELKKFGYKLYHNSLPGNLLQELRTDYDGCTLAKQHCYNTRNKKVLNLPRFNKKIYQNSFLVQSIKKFSELPIKLKNIPNIVQFTRQVKKTY